MSSVDHKTMQSSSHVIIVILVTSAVCMSAYFAEYWSSCSTVHFEDRLLIQVADTKVSMCSSTIGSSVSQSGQGTVAQQHWLAHLCTIVTSIVHSVHQVSSWQSVQS